MQEHFYESGNCVQIICATLGVHPSDLGTTCVQEGGFEGPENGPKQRRINNRLLSYRPKSRNNLKILAGERGPAQLQPLGRMLEVKKTASTAQTRRLAGGCSLQVIP